MSTSMTLNDLKPKNIISFSDFSRFLAVSHILRVNCIEMAGDQDNLCRKFLALSVDFIAASCNPLGLRRVVHVDVKEG